MNITKNTESSSVVVQWDEVDNSLPTTYIVTWTSERDLNNVQVKILIEQSSYTITGLTLDTVYIITVTTSNRCGTGPEYSTSVSLTTDTTVNSINITPTITAKTNTITIVSTAPPTITSVIVSPTPTVNLGKSANTTSHCRNVVIKYAST